MLLLIYTGKKGECALIAESKDVANSNCTLNSRCLKLKKRKRQSRILTLHERAKKCP